MYTTLAISCLTLSFPNHNFTPSVLFFTLPSFLPSFFYTPTPSSFFFTPELHPPILPPFFTLSTNATNILQHPHVHTPKNMRRNFFGSSRIRTYNQRNSAMTFFFVYVLFQIEKF